MTVLKISDFAKLSRVSMKALRYYDELGLLRPVEVDRFTSYRYYSPEQLPRLYRILALKDLGFSLEQVAQLLDAELSPTQVRSMLQSKLDELKSQVEDAQAQLVRLETRLKQVEMENGMSNYDVILKPVEAIKVASVRDVVPTMEVIGPTFDRLFDEVANFIVTQKGEFAGPGIALYYDPPQENMSVEIALPVKGITQSTERVKVYDLPAVPQMACTIHHGPFATLSQAYRAVMSWIDSNGYHISGPSREVNLQYERGGDQTKYVTEIQLPVEKNRG